MFKSWQVFVFSLVPLALVFAGVIIGSFHGSDSSKEVFPTPPPSSSSSGGGGGSGGSGAAAAAPGTLTLVASNLAFDKRSLTALPNTRDQAAVREQGRRCPAQLLDLQQQPCHDEDFRR